MSVSIYDYDSRIEFLANFGYDERNFQILDGLFKALDVVNRYGNTNESNDWENSADNVYKDIKRTIRDYLDTMGCADWLSQRVMELWADNQESPTYNFTYAITEKVSA